MTHTPTTLKTYRVRLGHVEICVKAHDEQEAIALARRQLGRDLPRLYDVIRTLAPTRFQVDSAA